MAADAGAIYERDTRELHSISAVRRADILL